MKRIWLIGRCGGSEVKAEGESPEVSPPLSENYWGGRGGGLNQQASLKLGMHVFPSSLVANR